MQILTHGAFRFGTAYHLHTEHMRRLARLFETSDSSPDNILGGRRCVDSVELAGIGPVIIKHYRRGGLLAHLVKQTYVMRNKTRCQIEFEQMNQVRSLGVQTPEPIAFAYSGSLAYRAWLITREIENQQSLAQLSCADPERAGRAVRILADQVNILIEHKILHADLHPGNILVDAQENVFIIDFDKSDTYHWSRQSLKNKYLRRWQRAVHKHGLPDVLVHIMRTHLN